MEGMSEKVKIVVNRVGLENGHITLKKARDTIGRDIFWQFPNDYRTMIDVRNNGIPLIEQAPKAPVTQAIVALADAICSGKRGEAAHGDQKKSGIGRFFNTLMPGKGGK
jgi:pilus assembly protein CpaE